ncbi:hypothetical protein [Actinomycetia phage DSL-LC01]|nr:hypothetical protein [Actinomycetia phage DSL-LC01]
MKPGQTEALAWEQKSEVPEQTIPFLQVKFTYHKVLLPPLRTLRFRFPDSPLAAKPQSAARASNAKVHFVHRCSGVPMCTCDTLDSDVKDRKTSRRRVCVSQVPERCRAERSRQGAERRGLVPGRDRRRLATAQDQINSQVLAHSSLPLVIFSHFFRFFVNLSYGGKFALTHATDPVPAAARRAVSGLGRSASAQQTDL